MNNRTRAIIYAIRDAILLIFIMLIALMLVSCKTVKRDVETDVHQSSTSSYVENDWKIENDSLYKQSWDKFLRDWSNELLAKIRLTQIVYDTSRTDSDGNHPILSNTTADMDLNGKFSGSSLSEQAEQAEQTHQTEKFGKTEIHAANDSTSHTETEESVNHTTLKQKFCYMFIISILAIAIYSIIRIKK